MANTGPEIIPIVSTATDDDGGPLYSNVVYATEARNLRLMAPPMRPPPDEDKDDVAGTFYVTACDHGGTPPLVYVFDRLSKAARFYHGSNKKFVFAGPMVLEATAALGTEEQ